MRCPVDWVPRRRAGTPWYRPVVRVISLLLVLCLAVACTPAPKPAPAVANLSALEVVAKARVAKTPDPPAILMVDPQVPYGRVVEVIDALKRAGVSRIALGVPVPPTGSGAPVPPKTP